MAWNRSIGGNEQPKEASVRSLKRGYPFWISGLILFFVASVGVVLSFCTKMSDDKGIQASAKTNNNAKLIVEQKSAFVHPTNSVVERPLSVREKKLKFYRDKYGDNLPENLKPVVYYLEHPPKQNFKIKGQADYLRFPSERQIASVLLQKPGTLYVLKPTFGDSFDKDFINSMLSKIEILDNDTDEIRNAKQAVIEAKKEIVRICKEEGRKPSEIMNEYAKGMYNLGQYQRNIEKELTAVQNDPTFNDSDVADFWNAANQLLQKKGLDPIPVPSLARRGKWLQRAKAKEERKSNMSKEKEQ